MTEPEEKPRIRDSEVEGKSRVEMAKFLVSRCTEAGALDRTIKALKAIGCNDEALKLESRKKPPSEKSSVSELGPTPEPLSDLADQEQKRSQIEKQLTAEVEKSLFSPSAPAEPMSAMSAKGIIRSNKTSIQKILCSDHRLILNKVYEKKLITEREYNNLKGIYKENVEGHIVELVDKLMDKGDETCQQFLNLLETDDDIKETFDWKSLQLSQTGILTVPVQETCVMDNEDDEGPRCKKTKMDEHYPVNSNPRGICLILNNINFEGAKARHGTEKDADSLAEVFSWLGFRVLMCEDQKEKEMAHVLKCFSTLSDTSELQKLSLKEWSKKFGDLKDPPPKHGDVFICCILSHGKKGVVCGTDGETLPIKDITRTFKASNNSPLTGKPKVFLIQACQGSATQCGVIEKDLATDEVSSASSIPEEADVLVAVATVEDYVSFRHTTTGSWFIQSLCQQLHDGCKRGDDIHAILQCVNNEVSQKEGSVLGRKKQMPEIRYTLRKKLMLSPFDK